MVTRAAFLAITPVLLASCEFLDRGPDIHFILLDGFHGEIRIEQGVADASDPPLEQGHYTIRIPSAGLVRVKTMELFSHWHKERAFSSNGRELPVLSGHAEQPDVFALRALGCLTPHQIICDYTQKSTCSARGTMSMTCLIAIMRTLRKSRRHLGDHLANR
jgi:hypothetical protein